MAERIDEETLYKQLKKAYQDLEIDENADEKIIKKKYRVLAKKYHPDANPGNKEAEEKFKAISVGYTLLADEKNRKVYQKLKERYEYNNKNNDTYSSSSRADSSKRTNSHQSKSYWDDDEYSEYTYKSSYTEAQEKTNKYIFKRRDGSTIEILPVGKVDLEGQTFYEYKVIQYYKDRTIINNLHGRINLSEILRNKEYCDFCVNNFLSKENIEKSIIVYNGFLGYIEAAKKDRGTFYRIANRDNIDLFDISIDLGNKIPKSNILNIDKEEINVLLEKFGTLVINGKVLNQYVYYSDYLDKITLIYSEGIDFQKYKKDPEYARAVESLVVEERVDKKINQGGYIGSVAYNIENDNYDIVIDKELEKILNVKQTEER